MEIESDYGVAKNGVIITPERAYDLAVERGFIAPRAGSKETDPAKKLKAKRTAFARKFHQNGVRRVGPILNLNGKGWDSGIMRMGEGTDCVYVDVGLENG